MVRRKVGSSGGVAIRLKASTIGKDTVVCHHTTSWNGEATYYGGGKGMGKKGIWKKL